MMDNTAIAWPKLDGADVFALRQFQGQNKVAMYIAAFGWQFIRLRHRQYDVWRSQLPAGTKCWRCGKIFAISFRHSRPHPVVDQNDLVVAQLACTNKLAVTRHRFA